MKTQLTKVLTVAVIILHLSQFAISQKLKNEDLSKQIVESVNRMAYIYSLDEISRTIFSNSVCWVFLQTHELSKEDLIFQQKMLDLPIFALLKDSLHLKPTNAYDSVEAKIKNLVRTSKYISESLVDFDSYEDPVKKYLCETHLDSLVSPKLHQIRNLLGDMFEFEKKQFYYLLELYAGHSKKNELFADEIKSNYQDLLIQIKSSKLAWELFSGSINWVYRPLDFALKKELTHNINIAYDEVVYSLPTDDQLSTYKALSLLRESALAVADALVTEDNYEDPIVKFLAEDVIYSQIYPAYFDIEQDMERSTCQKFTQLTTLILDHTDSKVEDTKKMLRYSNLVIYKVTNVNSSDLRVDDEALLDRLAVIYSKRFTHKEIKQINAFYETRAGSKLRRYSKEMAKDLAEVIQKQLEELIKQLQAAPRQ